MRLLLALAAFFLVAAAPFRIGPMAVCPVSGPGSACAPADLREVRLTGPGATLVSNVDVDPAALPLPRPLMVTVITLASSAVRWNGVAIGRNGVPGPDRASEL